MVTVQQLIWRACIKCCDLASKILGYSTKLYKRKIANSRLTDFHSREIGRFTDNWLSIGNFAAFFGQLYYTPPHCPSNIPPHKLLGHFQEYQEAEIFYVDYTHKYKIIQGVMVGSSPSLGWSRSNYNLFYCMTFRILLGMVGG